MKDVVLEAVEALVKTGLSRQEAMVLLGYHVPERLPRLRDMVRSRPSKTVRYPPR